MSAYCFTGFAATQARSGELFIVEIISKKLKAELTSDHAHEQMWGKKDRTLAMPAQSCTFDPSFVNSRHDSEGIDN